MAWFGHARKIFVPLTVCTALLATGAPGRAQQTPDVAAVPVYTLEALLTRAARESPALNTSRAAQATSRAGLITARAYPNPEFAIEQGRLNARRAGADTGSNLALSWVQPIESPWLRDARLRGANARVDFALAQTAALQTNLNAAIRDAFFDQLKFKAQLQGLTEDLQLTEQIRDRIAARVRIGEAPRFDLLRAENEVAGVRKNLDATRPRIRQAQLALRQLVSPSLEADFDLILTAGDIRPLTQTDYLALKYAVVESNPDMVLARQALIGAERQVEIERQQVLPRVELRATHERDPSVSLMRIGAQVTLPLLDRREGPIAEATAEVQRARLALDERRFDSDARFEAAWQAYQGALAQESAIQNGILERARQVLLVAEAAYRLGERGIIEYLDAQRQFRLVRAELLDARLDLQRARSDLERLAGR